MQLIIHCVSFLVVILALQADWSLSCSPVGALDNFVQNKGGGVWSSWTHWSKCTCSNGTTFRTRNCSVEIFKNKPRNNDTMCAGPDVELSLCVQPSCFQSANQEGEVDVIHLAEKPPAVHREGIHLAEKPTRSRKPSNSISTYIMFVVVGVLLIFLVTLFIIKAHRKIRVLNRMAENIEDINCPKLQVDLPIKSATPVQSYAETYSAEIDVSSQTTPMPWLDYPAIFGSSMESLDNSCCKQRVDLLDKTATAAAVEAETCSFSNASWESDNECPFTELTTPMGFLDSSLASCQSLVKLTAYPYVSFPPEVDEIFVSCAPVDHTGGCLTIPGTHISLFVPPLAIPKGRVYPLYISLLEDQSKKNPLLCDREAMVSPVVVTGPNGTKFDKPVTISIPHSALIEEGSWDLRAICDESDTEMLSDWKDVAPEFQDNIKITQNMFQFSVNHFSLHGMVGISKNGRKRVKIVTYMYRYVSFCENVEECWINVHCVDDTAASLKQVDQKEQAHGGRMVDIPKLMLFEDGGNDLTIRLEKQQGDWEVVAGDNCQTIPFEQIWKQASDGTPKCMFHLKRTGQSEQQLRCQIKAQQCPKEFEQEVLVSGEFTQVGQVGCESFELSSPWSVASAPENSLLDEQPVNNEQMRAEAACEQKTVIIVAYIRFAGSAGDGYVHFFCVDNIELLNHQELMDQGRRIDTPKLFTLESNEEDLKISLEGQPNGWKEFPDRDVQSSCKIIPLDHIKKQAPGSNPCCTYLFRRTDQSERQLRCHFKLYQKPGKFEQEILVSEELTIFTQVGGEATGMENGNMTPLSGSSGYFSLDKTPEVTYTIPSQLRRKLAIMLDPQRDSDWRLLAEMMEVDSPYIDYMIHWLEGRAGKSPTDHLLTEKWEEQNRPLSDLPELLKAIGRFDALEATKDYLEGRETRL